MSANQIGGFFNRLEASRKYLFGSVGVLGKANDSIISGAIIVRGQEAEPVVSCAPDWESYSFTRLDLEKADEKEFFEGAMAWDLVVDGKEWVDGKVSHGIGAFESFADASAELQVIIRRVTAVMYNLRPKICCILLCFLDTVADNVMRNELQPD